MSEVGTPYPTVFIRDCKCCTILTDNLAIFSVMETYVSHYCRKREREREKEREGAPELTETSWIVHSEHFPENSIILNDRIAPLLTLCFFEWCHRLWRYFAILTSSCLCDVIFVDIRSELEFSRDVYLQWFYISIIFLEHVPPRNTDTWKSTHL